jgi:N-methylhydantoinase A/oxoprolinase/acetone carboxylase beta subunit
MQQTSALLVCSAYGLAVADVVHEEQMPCALLFTTDTQETLKQQLRGLTQKALAALALQHFTPDTVFGTIRP